jgi:biotin carboxylase
VKTVLILGAGVYHVRAIEEARAAGYRVVVVDRDPSAPGFAAADAHHAVDMSDSDAVVAVARSEKIDAVLPLNDFAVPAAAQVAAALGLRGLTPEVAALACDKGLMRQRWGRDGLAQPDFRIVTDIDAARAAAVQLGVPLIVKPADSGGGGRGVSVVRSIDELEWAYDFAVPHARNGRVLVEGFLDGTEMTVELIARGGEAYVLASSDKVKPPLRTRVATRLIYPPALDDEEVEAAHALARAATTSLGLTDGPAHVELIITDEGPKLVEIGARGGGGHIFSVIVEAASGIPMVRESVRVLAGDPADLQIRNRRGCVYHLFVPESGVVREIVGLEAASALDGVLAIGITRKPGDVLGELVDSLQRSGYAVIGGRDREQAIRRADAVADTVVFELNPLEDAHASTV